MQASTAPEPAKLATLTVACPRCLAPLAIIKPDSCAMIEPGTMLCNDGDAIPNTPRQLDSYTCLFMASFGHCVHCKSRYWFLDCYLHTEGGDAIYSLLAEDLDKPDLHYTVQHPAGPWLVRGYATDHGRAFSHSIGPLLPCADGYNFWHHASTRATDLLPDISAVQTAVTREAFSEGLDKLSVYKPGTEGLACGSRRIIDDAAPPYPVA